MAGCSSVQPWVPAVSLLLLPLLADGEFPRPCSERCLTRELDIFLIPHGLQHQGGVELTNQLVTYCLKLSQSVTAAQDGGWGVEAGRAPPWSLVAGWCYEALIPRPATQALEGILAGPESRVWLCPQGRF